MVDGPLSVTSWTVRARRAWSRRGQDLLQGFARVFGGGISLFRDVGGQRHDGLGDLTLSILFQDQDHALAAAELGRLLHQERADLGRGPQGIEAQARICQTLEGLADIHFDFQVREQALLGELVLFPVFDAELEDFTVFRDLVERIAPQACITNIRNAFQQEIVGALDGLPCLVEVHLRLQGLGVSQPDRLGWVIR